MKRLISLALLVLVIFVRPVAAQTFSELRDGNRPFGDWGDARVSVDNFQLVNEMKLVISHLRLAPLNPREVCSLWERYDASHVLTEFVQQEPKLLAVLGTTEPEVKGFRNKTASAFAQKLNDSLGWDGSPDEFPPTCGYWGYVGANTIFRRIVELRNAWEIARELILLRSHETLELTGRVYSQDVLMDNIKEYIRKGGGTQTRKAWLDDHSFTAADTLREWLVEYGFAPSLLGLTAEQTTQLLEESGKR